MPGEEELVFDAVAYYAVSLEGRDNDDELAETTWSTHVALARAGLLDTDRAAISARRFAEHLADCYRYKEADTYAVLFLDWSTLDPDAEEILAFRAMHASWLEESGRLIEAIELLENLLTDWTRIFDFDHANKLGISANLANDYAAVGRVAEAIAMGEKLLPDTLRILGSDDFTGLTVRANLANHYAAVGRLAEAIELERELLPDCYRILGPDDLTSLAVRNNLANHCRAIGRVAEAITMQKELSAHRRGDHDGGGTARRQHPRPWA